MRIDSIKIKLLMADQEINQTVLGDRSGISRQNIRTILNRGTCSVVSVGRIANALCVDAREIIKED